MERALVMAANILSDECDVEIVIVRPPPERVREQLQNDLASGVKLTLAPSLRQARRRVRTAERPVLVGIWTVARSRALGPRRHGWVWWEHSVTAERLRLSGRLRLVRRLAALSTDPGLVVVPAAFMKPETEQRVGRPVTVIPNGGVGAWKRVAASPRRSVESPVLGTMGRLHASRRTDLAIRSLVHLPAAELRIAGHGPERASLQQLSRELGVEERVVFEGWMTDKAEFFSTIDLLVVTSSTETFGYALFEAAESSVPVVACPNPRTQEIIPRLVPGVLANGGDDIQIAAAVTEALGQPLSDGALASAARLRQAELSPDLVHQRWCQILCPTQE